MKDNKLINELKSSYIRNYTNMVVDEFLAYYKYKDITEFNFKHIVNGIKDPFVLKKKDIQEITNNSKEILKNNYNIEIIEDNPIQVRKELVVQ